MSTEQQDRQRRRRNGNANRDGRERGPAPDGPMHGQWKRESAEHRRSPSNVARSVLQDGVPQRR